MSRNFTRTKNHTNMIYCVHFAFGEHTDSIVVILDIWMFTRMTNLDFPAFYSVQICDKPVTTKGSYILQVLLVWCNSFNYIFPFIHHKLIYEQPYHLWKEICKRTLYRRLVACCPIAVCIYLDTNKICLNQKKYVNSGM